jgi:formylglycine-generating enzyme required for sulfatase activity
MDAFWARSSVLLALLAVWGCELVGGIDDKTSGPDAGIGGGATSSSSRAAVTSASSESAGGAAGSGGNAASSASSAGGACGSGGGNSIATPTSCKTAAPGTGADCGVCPVSCCDSPVVQGGDFKRSYDGQMLLDDTAPAHVSTFHLDRFEVTVGRFRAFVNAYPGSKPKAGDGAHPLIPNSGWDATWNGQLPSDRTALIATLKCHPGWSTWTDDASGDETLPMSCIIWPVAFAFCAWDGGRLPTEAEWNYAAAGGSNQFAFPWGFDMPAPDASLAVYGCFYKGNGTCTGIANVAPVGSIAAGIGFYGQMDLAGNVWEWNLDWHVDAYPLPCSDCANLIEPQPPSSAYRVIRGAGFPNTWQGLRAGDRGLAIPTWYDATFGVRCARDI